MNNLNRRFGTLTPSGDPPSLTEWVQNNIALDGSPFGFSGGHEYLRQIYADSSPDITIEKAAQMGLSTWQILDSLHGMKFGRYPIGVIYFFPSRTFMSEFSKSKIQNIIDENSLGSWFTETDSAVIKKI